MRVILKVVGGKNDGREIRISVPEFIIGRGDEAHLKPTSDLVSRKHCAIRIGDGQVVVEDLKSRNGTFVNGAPLTDPHVVQVGDTLRVGRLQFELVIDHVQSGNKKPKVESVADAATRTAKAAGVKSSLEDSISDWLEEEDVGEKFDTSFREKLKNADTIHMNLEDTGAFSTEEAKGIADESSESGDKEIDDATVAEEAGTKKKSKKKFGKLPPIPKFSHDDSTTAADDVLKKFFNRR